MSDQTRDLAQCGAARSSVECGDCPPSGSPDKERCGACPQRMSPGRDTELLAALVYESMRFSIWAAGQGLMAEKGEPTLDPEDFLFDYSKAMDIDDWEGLAEVARDHIKAVPQTAALTPAASEAAGHEDRRTFTIPPGHEAVRDADGRATGETRPIGQPNPSTVREAK